MPTLFETNENVLLAKSGVTVAPATSSTRVSRSSCVPELKSFTSGETVTGCPTWAITWSAVVTGSVEPCGRTSNRTVPSVTFCPSDTKILTSLRPSVPLRAR